MMIRH